MKRNVSWTNVDLVVGIRGNWGELGRSLVNFSLDI